MEDLGTYAENTWCPGCGNFGILNAFKSAVKELEKKGIGKEKIIISTGIGCHGKIFDYLNLSGFYSLHGRSMATIQGMKLGNPDLKVITFQGDGDAFGEGLEHLIFAAKRNAHGTLLVHDNGAYSLTTGQFTPVSEKGFKGPSTPRGSIEEPLNPFALLLEAGATFVARGYSGKVQHLTDLIVKAVQHEGFSFVDILQPCVTYNNTYKKYNALVEVIDKTSSTLEEAIALSKRRDKLPIGIIFQIKKPVFHKQLYGDWNPVLNRMSRKDRLERIAKLLK